MNNVVLTGRLTKDVELRNTQSNKHVTRFTLAVDRDKKDAGADFVSCVAWDKTAEALQQYCRKGSKIAVNGRIQTGKYERNGQTVFTTDVVVGRLEFLESKPQEPKQDAYDDLPPF